MGLMLNRSLLTAFHIAVLAVSLGIAATAREAPAQQTLSSRLSFEVVTRDRWIHGREKPLFVPPQSRTTWVIVESLHGNSTADSLSIRGHWINGRTIEPFAISAGINGRLRSIAASLTPIPVSTSPALLARPRSAIIRLVEEDRRVSLPAARVWDLVPTFHPSRLVTGASWTDTVALETSIDEYKQSLRGVRTSRIVKDTVVGGRRLWIVADSASVTYNEVSLEWERTLNANVTIEKTASGFIRGRLLYDPTLGIHRGRHDTTALRGTAVLIYPDARRFPTAVTFERSRDWTVYEPFAYVQRQEELRADTVATRSFNSVGLPVNPLEERLYAGETAARDSLFTLWRSTTDPVLRNSLYLLLSKFMGRFAQFEPTLTNARIASGDTAFLYSQLARSNYPNGPITEVEIRKLLPFMEDPGLAFAFNVSRDIAYENLIYRVRNSGPITNPQTTTRYYTPAALNLMAAQWQRNVEPRLRHVGLYTTAMMNPAYADTLLREYRAGRAPLLAMAAATFEGIASASASLPDSLAAWTAWRDWLGIATRPTPAGLPPNISLALVANKRDGIRSAERVSGRSITSELQRKFIATTSDSAKLVFGIILNGLSALPWSADDLARVIKEGPESLRSLAIAHINYMNSPVAGIAPVSADSTTADAIVDRLLTYALLPATMGSWAPWRTVAAKQTGVALPFLPPNATAPTQTLPRYLASDTLNSRLRNKWRDSIPLLSEAEWQGKSAREGGLLITISDVKRVGPFVRVGVMEEGRAAVGANQAPSIWARSVSYILMEFDGEWVIVSRSAAST